MLAGYVTYDELLLITGYSEKFLNRLIIKGLNMHEADLEIRQFNPKYKQRLYNLQEVEEWLRIHVY